MRLASSLTFALALLVPAGCGRSSTGPSLHLAVVEATRDCAPNDGPAVAIRFASAAGESPAPPVVQVAVYRSPSELAGRRWELPSDRAHAWIRRTMALEFDPATDGFIALHAVDADGTIHGTIEARFPDGTRLDQRFRAAWRERTVLCG